MTPFIKKTNNTAFVFHLILIGIGVFICCILVWSLVFVGKSFIFDADELIYIDSAYQMRIGQLPYKDFLFSYSPLLQWILMPFISIQNPIGSMETARILSIGFFLLRMVFTAGISIAVLGVPFGLIAIVGILIDPLTSFTAMQVRPDVIGVFFQAVLLGLFFVLKKHPHKLWYLFYGSLIVLTPFASMKIAPFVVGMCIVSWIFDRVSIKKYIRWVLVGMAVSTVIICWLPITQGILLPMIYQMTVVAKANNYSLLYPLNILNFYWPINPFLYGVGNQYAWYFELSIPLFAAGSLALLFLGNEQTQERNKMLPVAIPALLQFGSLLFVRSVFLQYHLASNWLLIILSIWLLKRIWHMIQKKHPVFQYGYICIVSILLFFVIRNAMQIYDLRAKETYAGQLEHFTSVWKIIPPEESVFPGFLWRKNGAYIGYGVNIGDVSEGLRNTTAMISDDVLSKISYLYLSEGQRAYLSPRVQEYINNMFVQSSLQDVWVRKK